MAMSRSLGGRSSTSRSPMWISPAVISSSPATIRSVVDLPQPEGPTRTMNSLSRMCKFTSLTAWTSSYFLLSAFSITWAIAHSPSHGFPGVGSPGRWGSALHGAGQPRDVVLDEERIDDRDRDRAEQGAGHQLTPEVDVAAYQLRHHADRHRLLLRRREKDEGVDELVPGQGEREDPGRQDARHRDGEDDADHGAEPAGAVDAGALLELLGDRLEVAHQQPGTEGDQEGRIGEDQRPRRIAELEVANDIGQRDEQKRRRHQIGHEDGRAEHSRHRELQS